jgi:hypothetical protein
MNNLLTHTFLGTREEWLNSVADELNSRVFKQAGHKLPPVKLSCSWALGNRAKNKKTLGQCFNRQASKAGINEIMIVPTVADSVEIADTLAHELVHAVDDCKSGHGKGFKDICLAVGLNGETKMKHAKAGDELLTEIKSIVKELGDYPHSEIDITERKKQTTRQKKVECDSCEGIFYTSRKHLEALHDFSPCPFCSEEGSLVFETGED